MDHDSTTWQLHQSDNEGLPLLRPAIIDSVSIDIPLSLEHSSSKSSSSSSSSEIDDDSAASTVALVVLDLLLQLGLPDDAADDDVAVSSIAAAADGSPRPRWSSLVPRPLRAVPSAATLPCCGCCLRPAAARRRLTMATA